MSATGRRERDKAQRREAANHKIGHDRAYWIIYGPAYAKLVLAGAAGLGVWWVWHYVGHAWIALVNLSFGTLLLMIWAAVMVRTGSVTATQMRLATGGRRSPAWHMLAAAGILFLAAAYAVWIA
jgi:hypothetical protein